MSNSSLEFPGPEDLANYTVFTINGEPPARVSIPLKFVPELAGNKEDEAFINGAFHYKHHPVILSCTSVPMIPVVYILFRNLEDFLPSSIQGLE